MSKCGERIPLLSNERMHLDFDKHNFYSCYPWRPLLLTVLPASRIAGVHGFTGNIGAVRVACKLFI